MKTSERGVQRIKNDEGFRGKPYKCLAGHWTIGFGERIGLAEVAKYKLKPMTVEEADKRMRAKLAGYEAGINRLVKVKLNQNQFDALASFVWNLGVGALESSTLLRMLNAGAYGAAASQFTRWNKAQVNGVMKEVDGLTQRRKREKDLFLTLPTS